MGKSHLLILYMSIISIILSQPTYSQASFDTLIPCNQNCLTLQVRVPEIKQTTDYVVTQGPYAPSAFRVPDEVELTAINTDDKFSAAITLPFSVCFFGVNYDQAVIGSNGIVTFDVSNAGCNNAYVLKRNNRAVPIPDNLGMQCDVISNVYYPRASIMGAYHDIYPNAANATTAGRKISYYFTGVAPSRKFVINYYHVPMFSCTDLICDEQIVIYESTGLIEVNFGEKPVCRVWNDGLAILGLQNWDADYAVAAPNKNCTVWSASNETYRFVPSSGRPTYVKSELYHGSTFLGLGDTVNLGNGEYQVTFPNACFIGDTAIFRMLTTYASCVDGSPVVMETLVNINHPNSLPINVLIQPGSCASGGNHTVEISSPTGPGYEYSSDGINWQTSPTFLLAPGPQRIRARNPSRCGVRTIVLPAVESVRMSAQTAPAKCYDSADGTITVTALSGTAPYQYSADSGLTWQSSNIFTKPAGRYNIRIRDLNTCFKDTVIIVSQPEKIHSAAMR